MPISFCDFHSHILANWLTETRVPLTFRALLKGSFRGLVEWCLYPMCEMFFDTWADTNIAKALG